MVENPRYQDRKEFAGEWMEANVEKLKKLKTEAYLELAEVAIQLEEMEELNI